MKKIKPQNWLIISHAFNMDGRAASQTITDKIPHLIEQGITPHVISSPTGTKSKTHPHYQVWSLAPSGLRFEIRHWLKKLFISKINYRILLFCVDLVLLPFILIEKINRSRNNHWAWWFFVVKKGCRIAQKTQFDVIYSTGGSYAAHIAAAQLKKKLNLPWICEIHDPLVEPTTTPSQEDHLYKIEQMICDQADMPFWFTEAALRSAQLRHPKLGNKGKCFIPGADKPKTPIPEYTPNALMSISHFGSLASDRNLKALFNALASLSSHYDDMKLQLCIFGGHIDEVTSETIKQYRNKVKVKVFERFNFDPINNISGRARVIAEMYKSDVLYLEHGETNYCREYIPSKLYEYLWTGRPILGRIHENEQLCNILHNEGHICVDSNDSASLENHIKALYEEWLSTGIIKGVTPESKYTSKSCVDQILINFNETLISKYPE